MSALSVALIRALVVSFKPQLVTDVGVLIPLLPARQAKKESGGRSFSSGESWCRGVVVAWGRVCVCVCASLFSSRRSISASLSHTLGACCS